MDLAFYTYFYGSDKNEAYAIPELPSVKYNCYYFTNNKSLYNKLEETKWIRIFNDIKLDDDIYESNMYGKLIKTCPHKFEELKNYSYLCLLDSKLEKVNELFVEDFINKYLIQQNYALLLRRHPFVPNCIWFEFSESIKQPRYLNERIKYLNYIIKQLQNGLSDITDYHCACGFLIRNMKHPKINEINETWYNNILECGIQDQISFFFIKQYFKEYILPFTEIPFI